jgi:hypothetical protein
MAILLYVHARGESVLNCGHKFVAISITGASDFHSLHNVFRRTREAVRFNFRGESKYGSMFAESVIQIWSVTGKQLRDNLHEC